MNLFGKTPTFEVGKKTAFYSIPWYASVVVHEAVHARLYLNFSKQQPGKKVPIAIFNTPTIERRCIKKQIEAGKKIGLPRADIKYLESLDGSHADLERIDW